MKNVSDSFNSPLNNAVEILYFCARGKSENKNIITKTLTLNVLSILQGSSLELPKNLLYFVREMVSANENYKCGIEDDEKTKNTGKTKDPKKSIKKICIAEMRNEVKCIKAEK